MMHTVPSTIKSFPVVPQEAQMVWVLQTHQLMKVDISSGFLSCSAPSISYSLISYFSLNFNCSTRMTLRAVWSMTSRLMLSLWGHWEWPTHMCLPAVSYTKYHISSPHCCPLLASYIDKIFSFSNSISEITICSWCPHRPFKVLHILSTFPTLSPQCWSPMMMNSGLHLLLSLMFMCSVLICQTLPLPLGCSPTFSSRSRGQLLHQPPFYSGYSLSKVLGVVATTDTQATLAWISLHRGWYMLVRVKRLDHDTCAHCSGSMLRFRYAIPTPVTTVG